MLCNAALASEHTGDYFWIVTNDQALNFKLMRAPVTAPVSLVSTSTRAQSGLTF